MKLRQFGIQGNRIKVIEGMDSLTNLEELYLSENKITEISGLDNLVIKERERECVYKLNSNYYTTISTASLSLSL